MAEAFRVTMGRCLVGEGYIVVYNLIHTVQILVNLGMYTSRTIERLKIKGRGQIRGYQIPTSGVMELIGQIPEFPPRPAIRSRLNKIYSNIAFTSYRLNESTG